MKKIAVHKQEGSFSDRWIPSLDLKGIPYEVVDCYSNDIIRQLEDVDCLLWHWDLGDSRSSWFAKELTVVLEKLGVKLFPNCVTSWHYDDKIAQKYLFEALKVPTVPSYVFYSKEQAIQWLEQTSFPKVFKLRCGAGSQNVRLVKSRRQAYDVVNKAFGRGFPVLNRKSILEDRLRQIRRERSLLSVGQFVGSLGRCVFPSELEKNLPRQAGYVYFQDFIPDNDHDTRLVVIGNRCFGLRRYCRNGDFRASGSGNFAHDPAFFPKSLVKQAFELADKFQMQSVAFDFVTDKDQPLLVEISYCFAMGASYDDCPGYWTSDLDWVKTKVDPQEFILEDFLTENSVTY